MSERIWIEVEWVQVPHCESYSLIPVAWKDWDLDPSEDYVGFAVYYDETFPACPNKWSGGGRMQDMVDTKEEAMALAESRLQAVRTTTPIPAPPHAPHGDNAGPGDGDAGENGVGDCG